MKAPVPAKGRFGCLGYGCIFATVFIFVVIAGLFFLARSAIRSAVTRFTTEQPVAVPSVSFDANARASADAKVKELQRIWADPLAQGQIILSQRDVIGLLGGTAFSGKLSLEFENDTVAGTFSFPMTALGDWSTARPIVGDALNRYITGSCRAKVNVINGVADLAFENLVLNGQVFDGDALKEANEWVSGFFNSEGYDGKVAKQRSRIESAKIANGEVVVIIKPQ